ncbi:MAG: 2-oxoglutarate dehydrogenase complex dihydrolipoyllysine-residue succinyltransferase [Akkermansiaceae bacterium]|nr:2-oxoglutarate dehydrogenase complex dihydrolipoyllysine-residue succinyltransferase [Akkermansiaceae bacterium]
MPHELKIPAVGESVTSATIAQWRKKDGDFVKADEVVVIVDTDKASSELEAGTEGILRHRVEEGAEVEIGAVIAVIEQGSVPDSTGLSAKTASEPEKAAETPSEGAAEADDDEVRATPVARKIAEEEGVDLAAVAGSGAGGRITKADVLAAADREAPSLTVVAEPADAATPKPAGDSASGARTTRRKMSTLRKKIAAHLVGAQQTAAILTTFNECDMTAVMSLRKRVQDAFVARHGVKLGFMSFFIKAVVEGLKTVPQINARIEGDEIVENHFFDIGVAVGTERGLVVPVVRDCDGKSFAEIEQAIADYAARARDGKIQLEDLQGGVFTISNGGIYGSLLSTPILNPPQSGILGMHSIQERPVAVNGEVVIRPMMYLALSYDHRLVDGREAVTFLIRVKECLEQPERLLVEA